MNVNRSCNRRAFLSALRHKLFVCLLYFVKVVNETLRLGNVVRFLHRKALKDVNYKGMFGGCGICIFV